MRLCSILMLLALAAAQGAPRLVINELMINEPGSETALEWVELFNASSDTLSLQNYYFIDNADTSRLANVRVAPRQFAVVSRKPVSTDGSASFEQRWGNGSGVWGDHSSESYPLILGKFSLRNSNDSVLLVDTSTGESDVVVWKSTPPDGVSLERVNWAIEARRENFRYSTTATSSTPGAVNSVVAAEFDLNWQTDSVEVEIPRDIAAPVRVTVGVRNDGLSSIIGCVLRVVFDRDFDGVQSAADDVDSMTIEALGVDSAMVWRREYTEPAGRVQMLISFAPTNDAADSTIRGMQIRGETLAEIVINEFMPRGTGLTGDWIELWSQVDYPLELRGWSLTTDTVSHALPPMRLHAGEKMIFCADPVGMRNQYGELECELVEFPGVRNMEDIVGVLQLRNEFGVVSDSLAYSAIITIGRSWERDADSGGGDFRSRFYPCIDPAGATPCAENSTRPLPPERDLAFASPVIMLSRDSSSANHFRMAYTIINRGRRDALFETYRIYNNKFCDSLLTEEELYSIITIDSLAAGDSLHVDDIIGGRPGRYRFVAVLPKDDDSSNQRAYGEVSIGDMTGEVLVTEMLSDPTGELESEWVEIRNRATCAVDLAGWTFGDSGRQFEIVSGQLEFGQIAVLAQDTAAFRRYYGGDCHLFALSGWSNLNNDGDHIILRDEFGTISDSLTIDRGWGGNRSWESDEWQLSVLSKRRWRGSPDSITASPCAPNSLRLQYHPAFVAPKFAVRKDSIIAARVWLELPVVNRGSEDISEATIFVYDDRNRDRIPDPAEKIAEVVIANLAVDDTVAISHFVNLGFGRHRLIAQFPSEIGYDGDLAFGEISIGSMLGEVIVTEILCDPAGSLESEWVEIHNVGEDVLELAGWQLGDATATGEMTGADSLGVGEYAIVAQDTAAFRAFYGDGCKLLGVDGWRSLNNDGDVVRLIDQFGTISDTAAFFAGAGDNRSLELNESAFTDGRREWHGSTDTSGATACRVNSVSSQFSGEIAVTLVNRVFAPSLDEALRISIACPPATGLTLEVIDLAGRRRHIIADHRQFSTGEIAYDGRCDYTGRLPVGAYVLLINGEDGVRYQNQIGFAVAAGR